MAVAGDKNYLASGLYEEIFAEAVGAYGQGAVITNLVNSRPIGVSAETATWQVINKGTNQVTTADFAAVTAGTAVSATVMNTDKATATMAEKVLMLPQYDSVKYSSISDQSKFIGKALGGISAEYGDLLLAELFDNFSNSAGTSSVAFSLDNVYLAISYLESNEAIGPMYGVCKPAQLTGPYGLSNELTGSGFGGSPNLQNEALQQNYVRNIAGVEFYKSTQVQAHDTTAAYGAIFVPDALGFAAKKFDNGMDFWIEYFRNAPYVRDEWYSHVWMGVKELVDGWGVCIDTKIG